ncbi:MAG: hypothetical protein IJQ63_12360 [Synergistaceae bacterium]|nr:hypothetical protein [Synergistaceae bacterium]MBR0096838.1 hypothetical protein [Synergistaceae bacterium]MBR0222551.1 hypothetical protein [Synergistaceae bacterium]
MSGFVLLRQAFNRTPRRDYARLGSDHTRIIAVKYELGIPDLKELKLLLEAQELGR